MVQAVIVNTWGESPTYSPINLPEPTQSQVRIKVVAAGFHNLVRSRAAGKHFSTANSSPPHIPGTDGVGTLIPSGELAYFNCLIAPTGSFADEINVEQKDVFKLPEGADPDAIAVLLNPTMSIWMALTSRAGIVPGQQAFSVAIIGATGVSGQAAVQIAKAMGATKIVAIGKPGAKLEKTKELGATETVPLNEKPEDTDFGDASDVDVVLDYLWGDVTKAAQAGIIVKRKNKSQWLTWVEIGALAGNETPVSAAMLRMANVAVLGCGPGSWTFAELYGQMRTMLKAIVENSLTTDYVVEHLNDVENWWNETEGPRRLVKP